MRDEALETELVVLQGGSLAFPVDAWNQLLDQS